MARHDFGNPPVLATVGKQTNPGDQTVHADTGALAAGFYEVRVVVGGDGANGAGAWQIQRRNAANSANVAPSPYTVYNVASQSAEYVFTVELADQERIRVTNDGARAAATTAAIIQVERLT